MLKNKIQLVDLKILIAFFKWFMNWAAPHPATGRMLQGGAQNGRFLQENGFLQEKGKGTTLFPWK